MATFEPLERKRLSGSARLPNTTQSMKLGTSSHSPWALRRRSLTATPKERICIPPWVALSSGSRVRLPEMFTLLMLTLLTASHSQACCLRFHD